MAPILSKFIKCKNGLKIPINSSNVRAIVNLTKKTTKKVPVKFFPKPGEDKETDEDDQPDHELEELLAQCPQQADPQPEPNQYRENETAYQSNQEYFDLIPCPSPAPNSPGPSQDDDQGENPPESIFIDGLDPVMEPNLTLKDIPKGHRAKILTYPGSDKEKRRLYFMEHHMDYYRYYELFDCWNECFITSTLPFHCSRANFRFSSSNTIFEM